MTIPQTAASRTRMIRKAIRDAGYEGRVTSSPASHRAQVTTVDQCSDQDAITAYLSGYLAGLAGVVPCEGFVSVRWVRELTEEDRREIAEDVLFERTLDAAN